MRLYSQFVTLFIINWLQVVVMRTIASTGLLSITFVLFQGSVALDFGASNIALNKQTWQGGQLSANYSSKNAVDGNTNQDPTAGSCFIGPVIVNPWWMVGVGRVCYVRTVVIYSEGCGTACYTQLTNVVVGISIPKPNTTQILMGTYPICAQNNAYPPNGVVSLECQNSNTAGRYIIIQAPITGSLAICEVEIYRSGASGAMWSRKTGMRVVNHSLYNLTTSSSSLCAQYCSYMNSPCNSFNYQSQNNMCVLLGSGVNITSEIIPDNNWDLWQWLA